MMVFDGVIIINRGSIFCSLEREEVGMERKVTESKYMC